MYANYLEIMYNADSESQVSSGLTQRSDSAAGLWFTLRISERYILEESIPF